MKTIMLSHALLSSLVPAWQDVRKSTHFNFRGANIYRVKGGLFQVVGHHAGEAQKTIDWLNSKKAEMQA